MCVRAPVRAVLMNPTHPHPRYMRASPTRYSIMNPHSSCRNSPIQKFHYKILGTINDLHEKISQYKFHNLTARYEPHISSVMKNIYWPDVWVLIWALTITITGLVVVVSSTIWLCVNIWEDILNVCPS